MRPALIVMSGPLLQGSSQMLFAERDDVIEEFSTNRPVEPFAMSIGKRRSGRSLNHFYPHTLDRPIDSRRESASAIVDQPFVAVFPGKRLPKLLNRPIGRWMRSDVRVENSTTANLHDHEDVEQLEAERHRGQEVASNDRLPVIAEESPPALTVVLLSVVRRLARHVLCHGSRRHPYADLQEKLRSDSFLPPRWILLGHSEDELLQILRYRWPSDRTALPAPEELEALPVPANEGRRLDDGERVVPVEETAQPDHGDAGSVGRAARLGAVLEEKPDLSSEEDVFGGKSGLWLQEAGGEENGSDASSKRLPTSSEAFSKSRRSLAVIWNPSSRGELPRCMLAAMRRRFLCFVVLLAVLLANPLRADGEEGSAAPDSRVLGREMVEGIALGHDVKPLLLELKALSKPESRRPERELIQVGSELESALEAFRAQIRKAGRQELDVPALLAAHDQVRAAVG